MTESTVRIQSEGETVSPHKFSCPESAYNSEGHLTFSGWLLSLEGCQEQQSHFYAGKTIPEAERGKALLSQWRQAGYPDLGGWPPPRTDWFDHAVKVLEEVLSRLV